MHPETFDDVIKNFDFYGCFGLSQSSVTELIRYAKLGFAVEVMPEDHALAHDEMGWTLYKKLYGDHGEIITVAAETAMEALTKLTG